MGFTGARSRPQRGPNTIRECRSLGWEIPDMAPDLRIRCSRAGGTRTPDHRFGDRRSTN